MDDITTLDEEDPSVETNVWVIDPGFQKLQQQLRIPEDPYKWNKHHIKYWIQWAVRKFKIRGLNLKDWSLTGEQLFELTHEEFGQKVPADKNNEFWTHVQLLKQYKYVTVIENRAAPSSTSSVAAPAASATASTQEEPTGHPLDSIILTDAASVIKMPEPKGLVFQLAPDSAHRLPGISTRTGEQLWQFLLSLLMDKQFFHVIRWTNDEGEFLINDPVAVAELWGARKNKSGMTYEKLSRALRYYYELDIIEKVKLKNYTYKFVCDLKHLVGYSSQELKQIMEAQIGPQQLENEDQEQEEEEEEETVSLITYEDGTVNLVTNLLNENGQSVLLQSAANSNGLDVDSNEETYVVNLDLNVC